MNKLTSVLALAAAMALASPQVMASTPTGHKSVALKQGKRVKKSTRKLQKAQASMQAKKKSKKKVISHRKSPGQSAPNERAAA